MAGFSKYSDLEVLAREKRTSHRVNTAAFGIREIRAIYKAEGIRLDQWPTLSWRIKALYMCDDGECSVAVQPKLPREPKLFALVHELKHHYCDQPLLRNQGASCGDYNANREIEVGAEVFAAEFIYPEQEFREDVECLGIRDWPAEEVVRFKRQCKATVSYTFLVKRLVRCDMALRGAFDGVQFRKLEEARYGVPFYRNPQFQTRRTK